MYDSGVGDMNNVPREGFSIAAKSRTGVDSSWGTEASKDLQDSADCFVRTTIHEFSHALGLLHPQDMNEIEDQTYTCPTISIVRDGANSAVPFPQNIKWSHAPIARTRLWHYPDIRVRPGGVKFALQTQGGAPWIPPADRPIIVPPIRFGVSPVMSEVPIGAPVRIELTLANEGDMTFDVPRDIGLRGHALKGQVQDPNGIQRGFQPFTICVDSDDPLVSLEPGKTITASATLFASDSGPLFPTSGVHTVTSILSWTQLVDQGNTVIMWAEAQTTVMVTGARSPSHAAAAHRILTEPETSLALILAGDHLEKGTQVVQEACKDATLGPHWECVEARRCARGGHGRKADISHVEKILNSKSTVMSNAERQKMEKLLHGSW